MKIHQVKIDFNVTVEITRFVYVYIIEAEFLYLIDSGVFGCEKQIIDYLDTRLKQLQQCNLKISQVRNDATIDQI